MTAIIISIGDELLVGQVVNTNASWLGDQLTRLGCRVLRINAIGDERGLIRREMESAAAAADLVFVSGGLGPTHDDVTRDAICDLLGCEMEMDADQLQRIEIRFADRGIDLNERSRRQALVPADCRRLPNDYGSAPGLGFTIGATRVFVLPGVPSEMKGIFTDQILPEIGVGVGDIDQTTFLVFGVTESALADALSDTIPLFDQSVTLAYLPAVGGIRLRAMRLTAGEDQRARYEKLLEIIREKAARWIIADRDETLMAVTARMLKERGLMLATAESCTGGMIGELITEIPGSSAYYLGGTVSYANSVKTELLGVPANLIEQHGAVSREVAEAMAAGVRERLGADIAVSVTGIAGPDGGTPEKPVGTVWIGISSERGTRAEQFTLGKERAYIRQRASQQAIDIVRREISGGN